MGVEGSCEGVVGKPYKALYGMAHGAGAEQGRRSEVPQFERTIQRGGPGSGGADGGHTCDGVTVATQGCHLDATETTPIPVHDSAECQR